MSALAICFLIWLFTLFETSLCFYHQKPLVVCIPGARHRPQCHIPCLSHVPSKVTWQKFCQHNSQHKFWQEINRFIKVSLKVGISSSVSRYLLKLLNESSWRFWWRHIRMHVIGKLLSLHILKLLIEINCSLHHQTTHFHCDYAQRVFILVRLNMKSY